jgi:hypothetical protein
MVAVWVKELPESVDKGKKTAELMQKWKREGHGSKEGRKHNVDKTEKRRLKTKLKTKCTASHIHKEIVQEAEKQNPHLKNIMSLRIQKLPSRFNKLHILSDTLLYHSTSTNSFLPRYVLYYSAFVLPLQLLVNNSVQFLPLSDPLCLQSEFHKTTLTKAPTIQIELTHIWCQLSCIMIYQHIVSVHICPCNLHCALDGCRI